MWRNKMRFKRFFNLQEEMELRDLNGDFLKKAMRLKTFSLTSKDLQFLKYKNEIQFIVRTAWFPEFDLNNTISGTKFDKAKHNSTLQALKNIDKINAGNLIHYTMSGIGPGEFMFYFMYNECTIGGGSSKGVDLKIGNNTAELKSIQVSKTARGRIPKGYINGFFMGGAVDTSKLANKIAIEMKNNGIETGGSGTGLEFGGAKLDQLKAASPTKYAQFEREFGRLAKTYFDQETVVFINNNKRDNTYGEILHVGPVDARNVRMDVITQGKIKPMVKI
jgi:hypothetical protein